jgi:hypothetical protein
MAARFIAALTTVAWLFLLFGCIVALFMDSETLNAYDFALGIALAVVLCCMIAASIYSVFRLTKTLPLLLLIASLFPGYIFARALWRLQTPSGERFVEILRSGNYDWFRLLEDVIFIGLPFCWAVVCFKLLVARRS